MPDTAIEGEPVVAPARDKRRDTGLGSLFAVLARDAARLVRQEIALAKAEFADRLGQFGAGAALLVAGGAILYSGLLAFLVAAGLALALVVPPWAAALIVGGGISVVGLALLLKGRRDLAARTLVPKRTLHTLREDAEWAKEQMR